MDYRERLMKLEIKYLTENLKMLSEEFLAVQDFLKLTFESQFETFIQSRNKERREQQRSTSRQDVTTVNVVPGVHSGDKEAGRHRAKRHKRSGDLREKVHQGTNPYIALADGEGQGQHEINDNEVAVVAGFDEMFDLPSVSPLENNDGEEEEIEVKVLSIVQDEKEDSEEEKSDGDSDFDIDDFMEGGRRKLGTSRRKNKTVRVKGNKGENNDTEYDDDVTKNARYFCIVCHFRFRGKDDLLEHVRNRHVESELRNKLACTRCFVHFIDNSSYNEHVEWHEQNPEAVSNAVNDPWVCKYCGRKCRNGYQTRIHTRSHTGEKPHVCSICPMKFGRKDSLGRHIKLVHHKLGSGTVVIKKGRKTKKEEPSSNDDDGEESAD